MSATKGIPSEDREQEALFQWAAFQSAGLPELRLLFAIPNGGKRHIKTAMTLKRTGVKPGVPDIMLPVARGRCHGMFIELKRQRGGVMSVDQKKWQRDLQEQGYMAVVCKGWEEASIAIVAYLLAKPLPEKGYQEV